MSDRAAALTKSGGAPDPLLGRVINDRFKVTALIARGGMGKVYRAEQSPLGRVCAVKVLNPNYAGEHDPEFHKRFFLEASIASKLTHPNTVTIFDYGRTEDDIYYMAMEYLDGHTLHRAIRDTSFFPEERAAHIARQICRALREAHSLGVIHRDLKPANIFLVEHGDETDFVKVLDFGLVKNVSGDKSEDLTQTGLFMGSPKYMAPEQIRGDRVDARTDIYALGIIMYEMLTGKVPFDRPNSVNILMAHVNEDAPPMRQTNPAITLSPQIEDTVARCMAKDPDQRFRSMDEVLAALKRIGAVGVAMTGTISGAGTSEYRSVSGSASGPQATTSNPPNGVGAGAMAGRAGFLSSSNSGLHSSLPPSGDARASGAPAAPATSGSKGMLVAAVLGALGSALVVGYVSLRPRGSAALQGAQSAQGTGASLPGNAPPGTDTAPAAPAPPATTATLVKVRVNTEPDGASVKEDGVEMCSSTPCDILYKGADADTSRDHKLTFVRPGYRSETKTVKVGDSPVTVRMSAVPAAVPRSAAPAAPARGEKSEGQPTPPGYKPDIPY
jgi:serine/threonine-protein kinase